jgi:hypothetical protein
VPLAGSSAYVEKAGSPPGSGRDSRRKTLLLLHSSFCLLLEARAWAGLRVQAYSSRNK